MDTAIEVEEKRQFHDKFCGPWNLKNELISNACNHVDILAKSCLKFLSESFDFQHKLIRVLNIPSNDLIHPFDRNNLSIASYVYKIYRYYFLSGYEIYAIDNENTGNCQNVSTKEFEFVSYMTWLYSDKKFQHFANHAGGQKKFGKYTADLYSEETKEIINFAGCEFHYHANCNIKKNQSRTPESKNCFGLSWKDISKRDLEQKTILLAKYGDQVSSVKDVFECEWDELKKNDITWQWFKRDTKFSNERPRHRLTPRVTMRGGLLETYALKWSKKDNPNETFYVCDVNSLYPYCAMMFSLPVGKYTVLIGNDLDLVTYKDGCYWYKEENLTGGAAHCLVIPPDNLLEPFLQFRVDDKFVYLTLCKMCAKKRIKVSCKHTSKKSKAFSSCYMITDLNKAKALNYTIIFYEIHHYPKKDFIFKSFMQLLGSERIKNAGGLDNLSTELEKQKYCDHINQSLQLPEAFKLTTSNVTNCPLKKELFKRMLNSVIGKLAQKKTFTQTVFVSSQYQIEEKAKKNEILSLFNISDSICQLNLKPDKFHEPSNLDANIYIAAEINARARCIIYDHLIEVKKANGKVFAVDTDSLFFSLDSQVKNPLKISDCFGEFKNVISPENIIGFTSLGPRNYNIHFEDSQGQIKNVLKVKGVSLKSHVLGSSISQEKYLDFVDSYFKEQYKSIVIPQVRMLKAKVNKPVQTLRPFSFTNDLYIKRYVKDASGCYQTYPYGYKFSN